ncbi:helix-turn-helix transcriptional regulator [Staphylococcus simulans]|uniref:helix-turn-helix domain-containing protein n=1 Tax=Staphylococcus simulans TaxID=1286 RepID=UPI00280B4DD0|nr:helix-turn-helix transcriptional regulator [Staphylococcus simulans]WMM11536.1 helix-turn-helix transcriptional regulator [Staphylococcus simulans]
MIKEIHYSNLVKKKRKELKMTQEEVARKVGISRSYLSDIENGKAFPSGRVLLKINNVIPIFLSVNDVNRDLKNVYC